MFFSLVTHVHFNIELPSAVIFGLLVCSFGIHTLPLLETFNQHFFNISFAGHASILDVD